TLLGTATVLGGNWSLDTTLAAGTYNGLKVTATDVAGNSSTTTNAQTIVDNATDQTESPLTLPLRIDTGVSGTDYFTTAVGVHFAGTLADPRGPRTFPARRSSDLTLLGTATVLGGNWSLDTTLAAGTYNDIKVTATDVAGNSSTTTNAQTIV